MLDIVARETDVRLDGPARGGLARTRRSQAAKASVARRVERVTAAPARHGNR